jgi:hypothetical protein
MAMILDQQHAVSMIFICTHAHVKHSFKICLFLILLLSSSSFFSRSSYDLASTQAVVMPSFDVAMLRTFSSASVNCYRRNIVNSVCVCVYVCMYACMCMYVCMYVFTYARMYLCMHNTYDYHVLFNRLFPCSPDIRALTCVKIMVPYTLKENKPHLSHTWDSLTYTREHVKPWLRTWTCASSSKGSSELSICDTPRCKASTWGKRQFRLFFAFVVSK